MQAIASDCCLFAIFENFNISVKLLLFTLIFAILLCAKILLAFTMPQYPNLITAVMSLAKENESLKM